MRFRELKKILGLIVIVSILVVSLGTVYAAPHPKASVTITQCTTGAVWFDFNWKHLGVDYYMFAAYESGNPDAIYVSGNYAPIDGVVVRNYSEASSIVDADINAEDMITVVMILVDKKGKETYIFSNSVTCPYNWPY